MISIIVPIYKAELYLDACLASIQKQTYTNFEVLCVNDGSPDNSIDICKRYAHSDVRFVLINQENQGVSAARNNALNVAKGRYICFVDSDDIIDSRYLEILYRHASDGSFPICSYSRRLIDLGKGGIVSNFSRNQFLKAVFDESIEHPNICMMLFKNSIIQTQQIDFHVGCVRNEDTEFYVKYLLYETNIKVIDYVGYYYRVNMGSAMHVTTLKSLTALDASNRIGELLCNEGITNNINIDLYPTIQSMLYHLCRERNLSIYNYLHEHYNIRIIMYALLRFPTLRRKLIALFYLCVGKASFYKIVSSDLLKKLPA